MTSLAKLFKLSIKGCEDIHDPRKGAALAWAFEDEYCSEGCNLANNCPKNKGRICFMEEYTSMVCDKIADREEGRL